MNVREIVQAANVVQGTQAIGTQILNYYTGDEEGIRFSQPLQRPLRVEHFVDRQKELDWLFAHLQPGNKVTLSGPAGIGKTALLAKLLWTLFPDETPPALFPDGLIYHRFYGQPQVTYVLEQIARYFGEKPLPTAALAAQRALNRRQVLCVFDGAEDADDLMLALQICAEQTVIIASRNRSHANDLDNLCEIKPLPDEDAANVIRACNPQQVIQETALLEICHILGNLPLSLCLAGRYLALHGEDLAEYLQWLHENPLEALHQGSTEQESVPLLLERSASHLSKDAQQVLAVIGLLAPTTFPAAMISKMLNFALTRTRKALNELLNYGFLAHEGHDYLVYHNLIHTYAHEVSLRKKSKALQKKLAQRLVQFLKEKFEANPADADFKNLVPHVHTCLIIAERYHLHATDSAALFANVGFALQKRFHCYNEAEPLTLRGLAIREQLLPLEHADIRNSLNNLAFLYRAVGKYREAEPLFQRVLALCEQTLGQEHAETATSLNNLAALLRRSGRYDEAKPIYLRALTIREKILGPQHPDTAQSLNNLALNYRAQKRFVEAESLLRRALAIREIEPGKKGKDLAQTLNNLADLKRDLGDYTEAIILAQRALAIREQALGADHPETAFCCNSLAEIFLLQKDLASAELFAQRAITSREKVPGIDHPLTAQSQNCLGEIYTLQGKFAEAEPLLLHALAIHEQRLGVDHRFTNRSRGSLAKLYKAREGHT
jgi:tetratricopeptide (TPR) repeat protein